MPCWSVGWWLWREGCISHETYLLYQDYYSDQRFPFTHPPSNLHHDINMLIMTWPWPSPTWTCSCLAKVEASHLRTSSGTDSLTWRGNILINGQVTIARGRGGMQNMNNDYSQYHQGGEGGEGGRRARPAPFDTFTMPKVFFKGTFWTPWFFCLLPYNGYMGLKYFIHHSIKTHQLRKVIFLTLPEKEKLFFLWIFIGACSSIIYPFHSLKNSINHFYVVDSWLNWL